METLIIDKPTFDESYEEIRTIVQSRRSGWTYLSLMEWSDVAAELTEHIWFKWHLFIPEKGPLENWCNSLISNKFINLRRDLLLRWARPCIGGWNAKGKICVHNLGNDACEVTKSHKQCEECPIYADWKKVREHQLHIKSTVALDYHTQEVHNVQQDFCDIEGIKKTLDEQMRQNLTRWEHRIYVLLFVEHLSPTQASERLAALAKTWKRAPREEEQWSYQYILQKQRWFRELMFDVLKREGYDLQAFLDYERRTN